MHGRGAFVAIDKFTLQTLNFAGWYQEANGDRTKETGLLEFCRNNNIGLTFPDLKEGATSTLDDIVFPFHLANHEIIVSGGEVQFRDYHGRTDDTGIVNPSPGFDPKNMQGLRDFGESAVNMYYFGWDPRIDGDGDNYWDGTYDDPISGPNVLATVALRQLAAAQAFYDSL